MKVKNRNLIELILQSVAVILLFVNKSFVTEVLYNGSWYGNFGTNYHSFLGLSIEKRSIIGFFTIALCIIGILAYISQFIGKGERRNSAICAYIPGVQLVAYIASALVMSGYGKYRVYCTYPIVVFYACGITLLVLTLISVIGYIIAKRDGIQEEIVKVETVTSQISSVDELKKLKDLLDAGIITQEEFDAKKKQLLGL